MERNVFIDFSIIEKSDLQNLVKELDVLIAAGKEIHVWSKSYTPDVMQLKCELIQVPVTDEEFKLHDTVYRMKLGGYTYTEIAEKVGKESSTLGYYGRIPPSKSLSLHNWIKGYHNKDSSMYPKVDILIDPDEKTVARFERNGYEAHHVEAV